MNALHRHRTVRMRSVEMLFAGLAFSAGCTAHSPVAPSDVVSAEALVRFLEHDGARVWIAEEMPRESFPFFSVNARRLVVNGESVHVFQYPDAGAATEEASRVAPSGSSVGGTQITWVDPPRFYKSDLLIVLYVGKNQDVSALLETILGPPFAGRR